MAPLITDLNLADPDAFYERLIGAHQGLDDADSSALNARLVLLLANHIGDASVLDGALLAAREGLGEAGKSGDGPAAVPIP